MKLSKDAIEFARLRAEMKWKQSEMAERLGISQSHVSQMENGERTVEERTMKLLRWVVNMEKPEGEQGKRVISPSEPSGGAKDLAEGELKESFEQLRELKLRNPEGYAAAKQVIYALSPKEVAKPAKPKPG